MIVSGLIKDHDLFSTLYLTLADRVKSKRFIIFLIACLGGVLPIPGRVVVSAGILDTVVAKNTKSRGKYGIIDFLATHHYYWWSPLEKTVAIPIAVLGLTYGQFMQYAWVPLFITILFIFYYVFIHLNENEVSINKPEQDNGKGIVFVLLPLIISVALMCMNIKPYIIFPFICIAYMLITKEKRIKKILSYVNWKLIIMVAVIIFASSYIQQYNKTIMTYLQSISNQLNIHTVTGFMIISSLAFTFSFVLGSSSKYAGIVALLCSVFGLHYLTYFLTLEFAGYILSPTHKCVLISSEYFKTPIRTYYKVLLKWSAILICYGLISIILH